MRCSRASRITLPALLLAALPVGVLAGDVLSTNGFTTCTNSPTIQVNSLNIQFDRSTRKVVFDVGGTNDKEQNVTASIIATAYGREVYKQEFNPCDAANFVRELCPVRNGTFSAKGDQDIPQQYVDMIPAIAFNIPDLDGIARMELKSADGQELACIESTVGNGKSMNLPAVSYIAAGIAASALALSALSALASGGAPGAPTPSPTFGEVVGWFQSIATSGMLSVKYPSVYSSFTQNFAFSTGILPWGQMQETIDRFRQSTGGNLTEASYAYLRNVTIVATANGNGTSKSLFKRATETAFLYAREIETTMNGQSTTLGNSTSNGTETDNKAMHYVHGVQAYVEQLMVPQANTFMTVLLIFAIVIAAITVLILLGKVVLEGIAMASTLPKSLESWRQRYWWRLAKTITNLIFILYGIWTLYCVYQFTNGDSWAAKTLAGVTWALFTAILAFFTWRIVSKARKFKKMQGDSSALFEDKEVWVKYSLFYDCFKKGYWWIFIPAIIYMFARNTVIAAANGHGMVQAIGQMIVEALMLLLLVWNRPYQLRSGNIINIVIQAVRVLSVVCILVFVQELGIDQTTQTVTGLVLVVVQSVLTGVLAILLAVNAIMVCVKENPHRKKRKEQEKMQRDLDNLTPLDARNSLLMDSAQLTEYKGAHPPTTMTKAPLVSPSLHTVSSNASHARYNAVPGRDTSPPGYEAPFGGRGFGHHANDSRDNLVTGAAGFAGRDRSRSPEARLPRIDFGR
ncbi:Flavin carrier protein 2 [Sphaceloma murrayae]|uniref:Flavin carrier protein 2 n=1 Tax=Sphaceloma murrayae TaxID=2082308 RepID=A0A2K1QZX6_9PEZI|nr:Flavin carrier protein 2 [Sphaceloma murrayae]